MKTKTLILILSTLCLNVFADILPHATLTKEEAQRIVWGELALNQSQEFPIWNGTNWYFRGEIIGTNYNGDGGEYGITNYPYPPEIKTNLAIRVNQPWETATNFMIGSVMCSSNLYQPAQFEPQGEGITTNIVISDRYAGTIQIGTNFYKTDMKSVKWTIFKIESQIITNTTSDLNKWDLEMREFKAYYDGYMECRKSSKLEYQTITITNHSDDGSFEAGVAAGYAALMSDKDGLPEMPELIKHAYIYRKIVSQGTNAIP